MKFANFFVDTAGKRLIPLHQGNPGRVHVPSLERQFHARDIYLLLANPDDPASPLRIVLEVDVNTYSQHTFYHGEHVHIDAEPLSPPAPQAIDAAIVAALAALQLDSHVPQSVSKQGSLPRVGAVSSSTSSGVDPTRDRQDSSSTSGGPEVAPQ
eukprot:m51a1_g2273 hypothetical protein (154) ;mRNA; r:361243-361887